MAQKKKKTKATYWHPAFFADIQIELKEDADNLVFESEHQLSKKPMQIDVLIIKKEKDRPVKKNIGRIFRKDGGSRTLCCKRRCHPNPNYCHTKIVRDRESLAEKPH